MKSHRLLACIALFAVAPSVFAQMTPTHRTTADGRPLASSKPTAAAGHAQSRPIQFQELAQHVDAKIIVTTEYGDHKEGRIESVSGSTLHLKTSVVGGYAVTNFDKNHIRSITLLP
jgi:hypothetical protein